MRFFRISRIDLIALCLLTVLSCIIIRPYFKSGYFATDDGEWAIVRLAEMEREIKDIQIPPRFSGYLNHGYGYPLFHFVYPLPYYGGLVLRFIHIGLTDSIKILFVGSFIASGIFSYIFFRRFAGVGSALSASTLYLFCPYRLVNHFIRGSLGECVAGAVVPLLFLLTERLFEKPGKTRAAHVVLAVSLLILSHNVSAVLFLPLWLGFVIVRLYLLKGNQRCFTRKWISFGGILGLILSAYFWLPAWFEKKYIVLSRIPLADTQSHFHSFFEMFTLSWFFHGSAGLASGLILLAVLVLSAGTLIAVRKNSSVYRSVYFFISACVFLIFTNSISMPLWRLSPFSMIDFPWRLLAPVSFGIAGAAIILDRFKFTRIVFWSGAVGAFILAANFPSPEFFQKSDSYYATNDATTTSADELMPIWAKVKPTDRPSQKVEVITGLASVNTIQFSSNRISFSIDTLSESKILVHTLYFPGWEFKRDNKIIPIEIESKTGEIGMIVPAGSYAISGALRNTPIRAVSNWLTVLGIVATSIVVIKGSEENFKDEKKRR